MLEFFALFVIIIIISMIVAWAMVGIEEFRDNRRRRKETLELINIKIDSILYKLNELYFNEKDN